MKFNTLLPLAALILLLAAPFASAQQDDSCSPIDLADPNPAIPVEKRPLSVVPIYQQGKSETCYAHGAAELADAWRFSHGDRDYQHLTDPLVVAVAQQKLNDATKDKVRRSDGSVLEFLRAAGGNRNASFEYGDPVAAFDAIRNEGSCPRSVISDKLLQRGPASDNWMDQHYDKFKKIFDQYEKWVDLRDRAERMGESLNSIEFEMQAKEGELCSWMHEEYGIAPSQLPDMGWLDSLLAKENPIILMDEMMRYACSSSGKVKHFDLPPMKIYELSDYASVGASSRTEYARKLVSAQFAASPPQPAGINMCADVFRKGGYSGLVEKSPGQFAMTAGCEQHVVVLAGRRRDSATGKCQWIIRNSWGPHDCEARKWPQEVGGRKKWDCLHGDFLVDEDAALKNLFSLEIYTANDPYHRK